MRGWVAVLVLCAGCHEGGRGDEARAAAPMPSTSAWAASASAPTETAAASGQRGDRDALAELLRAASARARASAPPLRPPGGETHLAGSGDVDLGTADPHARSVDGDPGEVRPPPRVPLHSDTRARARTRSRRSFRAELYWELTQRCRDEHEAILPPGSVEVTFDVDDEGYLVTSTISAIAKSPAFERAALCMRREVARSGYRVPPSARGAVIHVKRWVPASD